MVSLLGRTAGVSLQSRSAALPSPLRESQPSQVARRQGSPCERQRGWPRKPHPSRFLRAREGQQRSVRRLLTVESLAARKEGMDTSLAPVPGNMVRPQIELNSLKAVLLDVDGTLANSDPLHFIVFRDFLQELGFREGLPIDEEFFRRYISGRHNPDICADLFPSWDIPKRVLFAEQKEARFRSLAAGCLQPVAGLSRLCAWAEARGLRRAAVTNADRANAELMISTLGLTEFFDLLVIGNECARAKPFPDPYQRALDHFGVSASEAFVVEDSPAGLKAAVAAGIPVIGVTTGQPATALESAGASFVIKDFNDPILWKVLEP